MKIVIRGTVQGVGFRPTVYRVATALNLKGYVLNKGSSVEIGIQEQERGEKDEFLNSLMKSLPSLAAIDEIEVKDDPISGYADFEIIASSEGERTSVTPMDTAICEDCTRELFDEDNRRYLYPFINCISCGARFSAIMDVPYDRANTSMRDFTMCEECLEEYTNPLDRRFHAQTISCPRCGPTYTLYSRKGEVLNERNPIEAFAGLVDDGALATAKSWGGMHLICTFEQANWLRKVSGRLAKPFAVMFRDLNAIEKYLELDEREEKLLTSAHRPIMVLDKRLSPNDLSAISPGLGTIGAYLPYSGLHYVLFHYLSSDGVIMTSANLSGEPMVIRNEDAFKLNADYFLLHNRNIVNRIDDSVLRCYGEKKFFLRRSRGFVPTSLKVPYKNRILSLGAGENVSASISRDGDLYTTQYIGNTYYYPTVEFLASGTERLMKFLGLTAADFDAIGVDLHPRYPTRRYGKKLSEEFSIELVEVQHHWAHAASLMLDRGVDEVIALALDGTGYGVDKKAWGGEILQSSYSSFERVGSLEELPLIGGEIAIKDPRRLVFAIFSLLGRDTDTYTAHLVRVSDQEAKVMEKLMKNASRTSSFGRVLDALSCSLGICQRMTYDGEPAMKLERYLAEGEPRYEFQTQVVKNTDRKIVLTLPLFDQLGEYMDKISRERYKADIAYSFVYALIKEMVEIAADVCGATGVHSIGITGGVSYDVPIVRMAEALVKEKGLRFLMHDKVPNGDGGISVGQNTIVGHLRSSRSK